MSPYNWHSNYMAFMDLFYYLPIGSRSLRGIEVEIIYCFMDGMVLPAKRLIPNLANLKYPND